MVVSSGGVERKLGRFMLYQGMQQYERFLVTQKRLCRFENCIRSCQAHSKNNVILKLQMLFFKNGNIRCPR